MAFGFVPLFGISLACFAHDKKRQPSWRWKKRMKLLKPTDLYRVCVWLCMFECYLQSVESVNGNFLAKRQPIRIFLTVVEVVPLLLGFCSCPVSISWISRDKTIGNCVRAVFIFYLIHANTQSTRVLHKGQSYRIA